MEKNRFYLVNASVADIKHEDRLFTPEIKFVK
jgi:hypothetical protein